MKWESVDFENVFCFCNGKATKYLDSGEYLVYGSNGVLGYSHAYLYSNAIIVGRVGAYCGTIFYCPNSFWASDNTIVLQIKDGFKSDIRFCKYMLEQMRLNLYASGSAQPLLTQTILSGLKCIQPPIETQKRIADILSAYDDLIENNQKQIKLLEEAAQRLYKEWFIDLHFPGHETTPIVNGIPAGWKYIKIGEILKNMPRTKQIQTAAYHKVGKYPIIDQSKEFIAGYTDDDEAKIDLPYPIIVFGDHTRILKLIQFPFAKGADGTQLIASNHPCMPQYLMYCSLVNVDISNYHYARHFKYLKEEKILVPSKSVATHFETNVKPIFLLVQNCRNKIWRAMQARDRLLPKLMSGEIEV